MPIKDTHNEIKQPFIICENIFLLIAFSIFTPNKKIKENTSNNLKTGVMCLEENKYKYDGFCISLGKTLDEVGSNLFGTLIEMDNNNIDIIYSEEFPNEGVGRAIMNRLLKSAGYKIINV